MDERLKRTIERTTSWGELAQLESNIKQKGALSSVAALAIKTRSDELGLACVVEKTGIDLGELSAAERKIVRAIGEYAAIKKRQGTNANRTIDQVRKRGLIDAAEAAVCKAKPTQGYQALLEANLEDLSYERIVVDHQDEFSARAIWYSRRTLGEPNQTDKAPAPTHSDVNTRTANLLRWLQQRATANNGYIPPFENTDAASAIGLGLVQTHRVVHGNIQSQLDFACYLCDLPPLGCVAVEPFNGPWGQYRATLQQAAQSRQWTSADFERVLESVNGLPGISHLAWREAMQKGAQRVHSWMKRWAKLGTALLGGAVDSARSERLPADVLNRATPEFVWTAVQMFVEGTAVHGFGQSTDFDLVFDEHRFPPKAVFGVALSLALGGKVVEPKHFSGGEVSPCFRLLRRAGFTVITKDQPAATNTSVQVDQEWNEGAPKLHTHWRRERAPGLALAKKAQYRRIHGKLTCERCGLDPVAHYRNEAAESCIEVHHAKTVVSEMAAGHVTRLGDLECLCANCHRLAHSLLAARPADPRCN